MTRKSTVGDEREVAIRDVPIFDRDQFEWEFAEKFYIKKSKLEIEVTVSKGFAKGTDNYKGKVVIHEAVPLFSGSFSVKVDCVATDDKITAVYLRACVLNRMNYFQMTDGSTILPESVGEIVAAIEQKFDFSISPSPLNSQAGKTICAFGCPGGKGDIISVGDIVYSPTTEKALIKVLKPSLCLAMATGDPMPSDRLHPDDVIAALGIAHVPALHASRMDELSSDSALAIRHLHIRGIKCSGLRSVDPINGENDIYVKLEWIPSKVEFGTKVMKDGGCSADFRDLDFVFPINTKSSNSKLFVFAVCCWYINDAISLFRLLLNPLNSILKHTSQRSQYFP